jgi:hypothetical protein
MARLARALLASLALPALAFPLHASTWLVDDDGGAGIHFTDIAPAVQASAPGDVVVVFPGSYGPFTLDKALVVLGDGQALLAGATIVVTGIPAGATAYLQGLDTHSGQSIGLVRVEANDGTVVARNVRAHYAVLASADVRLHDLTYSLPNYSGPNRPLLDVAGSRVELVRSALIGSQLYFTTSTFGADGAPAIRCGPESRLHFAQTTARGLGGENNVSSSGNGSGGDGGAGLFVDAGAEAVLAGGTQSLLQGGDYGYANHPFNGCAGDGDAGNGLRNLGFVRHSGVAFVGGGECCNTLLGSICGTAAPIQGNGTLTAVAPIDPVLLGSGSFGAGTTFSYLVHGEPGARAGITFGRAPVVGAADQGPTIGRLTSPWPAPTVDLGVLPANGTATFDLTVPALPIGTLLVAQATVRSPDGTVRRSNSVPSVVE